MFERVQTHVPQQKRVSSISFPVCCSSFFRLFPLALLFTSNYLFSPLMHHQCRIFVYEKSSLLCLGSNIGATILTIVLFAISVPSFTYAISFVFDNHITAQNIALLVFIITGPILLVISIVLDILPQTNNVNKSMVLSFTESFFVCVRCHNYRFGLCSFFFTSLSLSLIVHDMIMTCAALKFVYRLLPQFCVGESFANLLTRNVPLVWPDSPGVSY